MFELAVIVFAAVGFVVTCLSVGYLLGVAVYSLASWLAKD